MQTYPTSRTPERRADFIVHAIGLLLILLAGAALMVRATDHGPAVIAAIAVYVIGALFSHIISMFYHLSPYHNQRLMLRRIDHAAIYLTIAGTFTPLFVMADTEFSLFLLAIIWALAFPAMLFKMFGKGLDSRWSMASYLGMGWMGLIGVPELMDHLPPLSLWAMLAGGLFYSLGAIVYARKTLPFRYSIWHGFVMFGGASFFVSIWAGLVG
ncbi:hemolysin III [Parasphingorhabdus marina DSM 22363]|uniref:Hemolysin III n=1 Tax=Parasphingorhabdus marina DSM 22363 TaxID=1123272 RepID=A0A1N6D7C4_9SPHN|nr:hemolysin III family protein [Parasphingorhabdus marina]SIN66554.1 hemolysin III [Parasphingorhabdus marina DSM 22363]